VSISSNFLFLFTTSLSHYVAAWWQWFDHWTCNQKSGGLRFDSRCISRQSVWASCSWTASTSSL